MTKLKIDYSHRSPNFNERKLPVDMLLLHYTGLPTLDGALAILSAQTDNPVSAHYVVNVDGSIYQLVDETHRAWHAGRSSWHGETDINSLSLGIEIVNGGHHFGMPEFSREQLESVFELGLEIKQRWSIDDMRVLGHSDVAPGRKLDPGEKFPWRMLARRGLGIFMEDDDRQAAQPHELSSKRISWGTKSDELVELASLLRQIGYAPQQLERDGFYGYETEQIVAAFQRHWSPDDVSGCVDSRCLSLMRRLASSA